MFQTEWSRQMAVNLDELTIKITGVVPLVMSPVDGTGELD